MKLSVRIAMRDWDYLTPILLGEVVDSRVDLQIVPVGELPGKARSKPAVATDFEGSETSLSRYLQRRASGDDSQFGIPVFPMRAFRHRCIITATDHPSTTLKDLDGGRIGVAGWQDSGNTWTRAALVHAGVPIENVRWVLGGLENPGHNEAEIERFGAPGWIDPAPADRSLYDMLAAGDLDAVFTPFMPKGFFGADSPFRPVLDDLPGAELAYFEDVGFVPGIHIVSIKQELAAQHPWLPAAITSAIDQSRVVWTEKRRRYAETTPWIFDDLLRAGRRLPVDWEASGLDANATMLSAFVDIAQRQGLIARAISLEELFPSAAG